MVGKKFDAEYDGKMREVIKGYCAISEDRSKLANLQIAMQRHKEWFFAKNLNIPDWLYSSVDARGSGQSSAAKFDPVGALSGEGFKYSVDQLPSDTKKPQSIILNKSFFGDDDEFKITAKRKCTQILYLMQKGFNIYCKSTDGTFSQLSPSDRLGTLIEKAGDIGEFEESDYEAFCDQYPQITRDGTELLDSVRSVDLNTLTARNYQFLDKENNFDKLLGYNQLMIPVAINDIAAINRFLKKFRLDQVAGVITLSDNNSGSSALGVAASNGRQDIMDIFLKIGGLAVNAQEGDRELTALHMAIYSGNQDIVTSLLSHSKINVNLADKQGDTPLHAAIRQDNVAIVKLLMQKMIEDGVDFNSQNKKGETAFHLATQIGNEGIMKVLLESGQVDVNKVRDGDKTAPLHIAASSKPKIADMILTAGGVDINALDSHDRSALHVAIKSNNESTVKSLLSTELINVNLADEQGDTPLHAAIRQDNVAIVKLLMQKMIKDGVGFNLANKAGKTVLHILAEKGLSSAIDLVCSQVEEVDFNAMDNQLKTPLYLAVENGNIQALHSLLQKNGINPNIPDISHKYPLTVAIEKNNDKAVSFLLQNPFVKRHVLERSKAGKLSADLFAIAKSNKSDILKSFIDIDVDVNFVSPRSGLSLYDIGSQAIKKVLQESGKYTLGTVEERLAKQKTKQAEKKSISFAAGGKAVDSDAREGSAQTFKMANIGESLNAVGSDLKIRDEVKVVSGDKNRRLLCKKPFNSKSLTAISDFKVIPEGPIDSSKYKTKDLKSEGEFHLFHYHQEPFATKGGFLTKLLSVSCQDELEVITVKGSAQIKAIFKDKDGFCYVETDKECQLSYVLKVPPKQRTQESKFNKKLQGLVSEYKAIREGATQKAANSTLQYKGKGYSHPGDMQFPRVEFKTNKEWFEAIYESGGGACRDRVKAFDYVAKRNKVPPDSYRIIGINNSHVAIEIKDESGKWHYRDLGGRNTNIEKAGEKLTQQSSASQKIEIQRVESKGSRFSKFWAALNAVKKALTFSCTKAQNVDDDMNLTKTSDAQDQAAAAEFKDVTMGILESSAQGTSGTQAAPKAQNAKVPGLEDSKSGTGTDDATVSKLVQEVAVPEAVVGPEEPEVVTAESQLASLKSHLSSSFEVRATDSFDDVVQGDRASFLVTKNLDLAANGIISQAAAGRKKAFYIDSPEKIDIFKSVLSLKSGPHIQESGFLNDFLQAEGLAQKPMIIINWDRFSPTQKVALNTILDESASIQGVQISDLKIVGLSQTMSKDTSFLSRQECFVASEDLEVGMRALASKSKEDAKLRLAGQKAITIDIEGHSNWRQKLFGEIAVVGGSIVHGRSDLLEGLSEGKLSFEVKNISTEGRAQLQYEIEQAKAFGFLSYQGMEVPIPPGLEVNFAAKTFDFGQFAEPAVVKSIAQKQVYSPDSAATIVNTRNFDKLLHDREITAEGSYSQTPGLIASNPGKELDLFITSQLSEAQYYCLFNEAQKHGVNLNLGFARSIEIPKAISAQLGEVPSITKEALASPPVTAKKITVTSNANKYLDENGGKIAKGTIILDIEDYSVADLVQKIDYKLEDGQFKFTEKPSQLIAELEKGIPVILKGQFSPDLALDLQEVMAKYPSLQIVHEEKQASLQEGASQFFWLGVEAIQVAQYEVEPSSRVVESEKSPVNDQPAPTIDLAAKSQEEIKIESQQFIEERKGKLQGMLKDSPVAYLSGPSGVGKSSLMRDYQQDASKNSKVYNELSSLKEWAKDVTAGEEKILFIDEANIEDSHLTKFAPLLRANRPITILHDGELIELTEQHKVVLAGNPASYGGGRSEQKLLTDYPVPIFEMQDFRAEYIYDKLLKEAIFDKVKNIPEPVKENLLTGFQKECQRLIHGYYQNNQKAQREGELSQAETVRELQGCAIKYLANEIIKELPQMAPMVPAEIKSESYITTSATKSSEDHIRDCLTIRSLTRSGVLPPTTGLGGIFLEGGSGIGKSSIIEAMTAKERAAGGFVKIDASMPAQQKIDRLTEAFEQGKIVQIDELNSCIEDGGLEKTLNAVLTGHHPETGESAAVPGFLLIASANKASMAGRSIIGPALRHRMHCPKVPELTNFKQEDIEKIVSHWLELPEEVKSERKPNQVTQISKAITTLLAGGGVNLRDLKSAVTKMKEGDEIDLGSLRASALSESNQSLDTMSMGSDASDSDRSSDGGDPIDFSEGTAPEVKKVNSRAGTVRKMPGRMPSGDVSVTRVRRLQLGQSLGVGASTA